MIAHLPPTNPLVRRLLSPDAYPHPVDRVQLVETHISWVFLTGRYVYKVKKPVDLGFLDFGTLEKRKHFCHEEVRLNRRFAPSLYLAAVPITGPAHEAMINGESEPLEWAVQLAEFAGDQRLDRVLDRGELSPHDCTQLAHEIAAVQEQLELADASTPWGTATTVADTIHMNLDQLREHRPTMAPRIETLKQWVDQQVAERHEVFAHRRAAGRVRQCHGDLHLANLVQHDGRFVAFDSIEFSEVLRWIDVASDVAFVVMDLESRGRSDLAAVLTSSWVEAAGDHGATAVLPVYRVYRAIVRSAVAAIRGSQPDAESAAAYAESDRYLALAEQLAAPPTPPLYATCGVSGCGKTTLARQLVSSAAAIHLRSDVERKRSFGMAPTERPQSADDRARLYSDAATRQTYTRLAAIARGMLLDGASVVVDAACTRRWQRDLIAEVASSTDTPLIWIAPQLSEKELIERVEARRAHDRDASDASASIVRQQLACFEPITADELAACPNARLNAGEVSAA